MSRRRNGALYIRDSSCGALFFLQPHAVRKRFVSFNLAYQGCAREFVLAMAAWFTIKAAVVCLCLGSVAARKVPLAVDDSGVQKDVVVGADAIERKRLENAMAKHIQGALDNRLTVKFMHEVHRLESKGILAYNAYDTVPAEAAKHMPSILLKAHSRRVDFLAVISVPFAFNMPEHFITAIYAKDQDGNIIGGTKCEPPFTRDTECYYRKTEGSGK